MTAVRKPSEPKAPTAGLFELIVEAVNDRWRSGDPLVVSRAVYFAVKEKLEAQPYKHRPPKRRPAPTPPQAHAA